MMTRTNRVILFLFLPILLLLLSTACDRFPSTLGVAITPSPAASPSPVMEAPLETIEAPNSLPQIPPVSQLRLWLPPEIGSRTEAGSQELSRQIEAYQNSQADIEVIVEQKPVDGQGGILNYLQTSRSVAPAIMPDIVAVPTGLLADSRVRDLFYPLDGLIDPRFINDIYPAPAGQVDTGNQLHGYPFATAGLTHLIYDPSVITETIPMNWSRLISDTNRTLVLPADSREGAMLGLQFYLAEGGRLADEAGQPILETEPLSQALATIGIQKANLLQSHQLKTLDEAWQYHQLGLSDLMWTRVEYLLGLLAADPALGNSQDYTAVPGIAGPLIPLTTSWAWAITTSDPARQALAADLIQFLTAPENLANWSASNQLIPARRSAMALLAEESPYHQFIAKESERAQAMPISETSRLMDVLGDAVFQVLTTENSPVLIAEQAATALRQ